ncbi:MAG: filamentous hemagglutinin N-terminal domain-containing protein [Rickettsiales bacterium]|nr:filamentous hemagglutinin N-terminal domain-containing protein [Rickettsiales bacterium]
MTAIAVGIAMSAGTANALPQGATVAHGDVSLQQTGTDLNIHQRSDTAIINWQNFDIAKGEATHFQQPDANSIALNRVTDSTAPSKIFGTLSATGRLVLVNPNGVFFGADSRVNVGGLIATSANISDDNFKAGNLNFDQAGNADASIVNQGTITAKEGGLVALVAPGVENSGVIRANAGTVALGTGETVAFDFFGDELVSFAVKGEASTGIKNSGTLSANGGTVYMTADAASKVVDEVINTTGVIEATSIRKKGGVIILGGDGHVKVSGKVNISGKGVGQTGGTATITGKGVHLAAAEIDASGYAGGGDIFIGGSKHGDGTVVSAGTTVVDRNSSLIADGINGGNGGNVILWSEKATHFTGNISAKGANNGGFAEVSSRGLLGFYGAVDLKGLKGTGGTLLLDPENVIIDATTTADAELTADGLINTADGAGTTFRISTGAVETALNNFANVVIEALNIINVKADIDVSTDVAALGNSLTLQADRILLNAKIKLNDGNLSLLGRLINVNSLTDLGEGVFRALGIDGASHAERVTVADTGSIITDTTGGVIGAEIKTKDAIINGTIHTNADLIVNASNNITIRGAVRADDDMTLTAGNNVSIQAALTGGPGAIDDLIINATKSLTVTDTGSISTAGNIRLGATNINLAGNTTAGAQLTMQASKRLTLEGLLSGTILGSTSGGAADEISTAPIVTVNSNNVNLQTALDIVNTGGRMTLGNTTFTQGGLVLDRDVDISGSGKDTTKLDASGSDQGITLKAGADNVVLSNFTIEGAKKQGIQIKDENKGISNLTLNAMGVTKSGTFGVRLNKKTSLDGLTIRNSNISDNKDSGIRLEATNKNTVANVRILDNDIKGNTKFGINVTATAASPIALVRITGNRFAGNSAVALSENITLRPASGPAHTLPDDSAAALEDLVKDNTFENLVYTTGPAGEWRRSGAQFILNSKIADGLALAQAGDTVNVGDGTYEENVTINKNLTLNSLNGKATTTIDANGGTGILIDGVTEGTVDINGFTFTDSDIGIHATANNTMGLLNLRNNCFNDYRTNGIFVTGDATTGSNIDHVSILDSRFEGNITNAANGGRGDINLFFFNNNATLRNLILRGTTALNAADTEGARYGIQLRGADSGDFSTPNAAAGNLIFDNVNVSGDYQVAMIAIQGYQGLPSLSMTDVNLGSTLVVPAIAKGRVRSSHIGQWWGAALRLVNIAGNENQTISLGNTTFNGVKTAFDQPGFAKAGDPTYEILISAAGAGNGFTRIMGEGTRFFGSAIGDLTDAQRFKLRTVISDAQIQNVFRGVFVPVVRGYVDFGAVKYVANKGGSYPVADASYFHSIQNTIDHGAREGDTVKLESGLWNQGAYIHKNITLTGATNNRFDTVLLPTDLSRLPEGFIESFDDNFTARPIIQVQGTNATITNLSVDGGFLGNRRDVKIGSRGYTPWERAVGIGFKNAGGTVDNVGVYNIRNGVNMLPEFAVRDAAPKGATPQGIGILADSAIIKRRIKEVVDFNALDADPVKVNMDEIEEKGFNLEIKNSEIAGFERTGIRAHGSDLTVNINNDTITGGQFFFGAPKEEKKAIRLDVRRDVQNPTGPQRGIVLSGNVAGSVTQNLIEKVNSKGSRAVIVQNVAPGFTISDNTVTGGFSDDIPTMALLDIEVEEVKVIEEKKQLPTFNPDTTGFLVQDNVMLSGNQVSGFKRGTDVKKGHAVIMGDTYTDNKTGIRVRNKGFATLQDNTVSGGDVGLLVTGKKAAVVFADKSTGSSFSDYEKFAIKLENGAMDDLDIDGRSVTFNGRTGAALGAFGETEVWDENDNVKVGDVIFLTAGGTPTTPTPPVTPEEPETTSGGDGDTGTDTGTGSGGDGGSGGETTETSTSPDGSTQALNEFNDTRYSGLLTALFSYFGKTLGQGESFTGNLDLSLFFGNTNGGTNFANLTPEQLAGLTPAAGGNSGLPTGPDECLNSYLQSGHSDTFDSSKCGAE